MLNPENDYLFFTFCGHGCRIVDPSNDPSSSPPTFIKNLKQVDKYVIWDGINEEPFTEDKIGHLCTIMVDGKLFSISEILAIVRKKPQIVPIMVFSCKNGQSSKEKNFDGKPRGVFSYFWNAIMDRDPYVTFRDAITLVNINMQQEDLEQRAEVFCRIDILDMPIMNVFLANEVPFTMILDMCRTELTFAEFERTFKVSKS